MVHLTNKDLHSGIPGPRLLERVLEPPAGAVGHHVPQGDAALEPLPFVHPPAGASGGGGGGGGRLHVARSQRFKGGLRDLGSPDRLGGDTAVSRYILRR